MFIEGVKEICKENLNKAQILKDRDRTMFYIGSLCQQFRKYLNVGQKAVAIDLNKNPQEISKFERGLNNNAQIYQWYINNGLYTKEW